MESNEPLAMYLKSFRLPSMADLLEETLLSAEREDWGYRRFLTHLCEAEFQDRRQRRQERLLKASGLPEGKSLANLDEALLPVKVRRMLPSLLDGTFVERRENVLCFGLPGRGKTHLAAALGRELVVRHGLRVLFRPAARLIEQLARAKADLGLEAELKKLDRFDLTIVDEMGYTEHRRDEMEAFFLFLSNCYERRSLMVTSNLYFSQWGERIFKDPMLGLAAVDRLVHHSFTLTFDNEGIRQNDATKRREGKG